MFFSTASTVRRPRHARNRAVALSALLGVALALSANATWAAALGGVATSVGLLATLAALFVIKGWPAHLAASTLSTAGGALLIAGGVAWLVSRVRTVGRVTALVGAYGQDMPPVAKIDTASAERATNVVLPSDFDREALLAALRSQFVQLQCAWDHADMAALELLTTPEMLEELCLEMSGSSGADRRQRTEVVTVRAELLGFEALAQFFVVSVEFSGLLRESTDAGAVAFRELWLLTRSKHGPSSWRLARHQALI